MSDVFDALWASRPAVLAPMEDVTDAVFRRLCRKLGARLCVTEFVNVENLLLGLPREKRRLTLAEDDTPTAIQIYGNNPETLAEAAAVAEAASPAFIDINCGCWTPKVAGRGAGAGWLRNPAAMVAMAAQVVKNTSLPVTVKTRIGWGPESEMPIVELAQRLEQVGVRAMTLHCRTAQMGHTGKADWQWAAKARRAVSIPVIVNGDIRSAKDAQRALEETGCEAVMIGRRAMESPWVFREVRALLDEGVLLPGPTVEERLSLCREHLLANVEERGEKRGVLCTRRHYRGYLETVPGGEALRQRLNQTEGLEGCLEILDRALDGPFRQEPLGSYSAP